jgi:hypothetical protein
MDDTQKPRATPAGAVLRRLEALPREETSLNIDVPPVICRTPEVAQTLLSILVAIDARRSAASDAEAA